MSRKVNATYSADQVKSAFKVFEAPTHGGHVKAETLIKALCTYGTEKLTEDQAKDLVSQLETDNNVAYNWNMKRLVARLNYRSNSLVQKGTFFIGVTARSETKSPKLRSLPPVSGGCSCGNVKAIVNLSKPSETYIPRCCDCDFCTQRGAAYVSDPQGTLRFVVKDLNSFEKRYQDADGIAQFLICKICDTLVGATYSGDKVYGTLNRSILAEDVPFSPTTVASPKTLDKGSKISRWRELWFRDVVIEQGK
eukprot:gene44811-54807_t